jgi:hypothetical protein
MAVSNRSISEYKYRGAGFDGKWLASFGDVPLYGVWFIYGGSGSGKTTFTLQLAKYLTCFGKVFFNSLEMKFLRTVKKLIMPADLKIAWNRVKMNEVGGRIIAGTEQLDELRTRLSAKRSPNIIIIDSLRYIRLADKKQRVKFDDLVDFFEEFPDRLFVVVGHGDGAEPRGAIGIDMLFHSAVKIHVEGYKAYVTTRFPVSEEWTGEPFVIWERGANEYWIDKI